MLLLYNLAMVDAIMLPIGVAVIASRSCELEHRGHTLKLLETAVTPGRLYAAKLAWGALVLAGLLLAGLALFLFRFFFGVFCVLCFIRCHFILSGKSVI